MKFNSLKNKIIISFMGLFTIFLIVFSIAFYYYFNQDVNNKLKEKLSKEIFLMEKTNKYSPNVKVIPKILNEKFIIQDLGESIKVKLIVPFENKTIIITKIVDDKSEDVVDTMLVIEPILLFLLLFAVIKLANKIFSPIEEITSISKKISIENFNTIIPDKYEEIEIKELIISFNDMIRRIQNGIQSLERFNNDISHELKTPLTIIKGEINITLKKNRKPSEYISSMNIILNEVEDMKKIIDNLLLLTTYTKENIYKTFINFDIDEILLQTIEKYDFNLNEKKIKLEIEKLENIKYYGNETLFYHIFSNLIDNSIKYSGSNSTIKISLYKTKQIIKFIIEDEGKGIPKEDLNKITQRFYRVDKSRNKNIEGFGLGLSIVKNCVNLHNGNLNIFSKENKGTKIILTF